MTDSSSFTSLFALVDSHLSKCNLNDSPSEDGRAGSLPMPVLNLPRGLSDTRLTSPPQRLPIPTFSLSESPIANVLSEQLSNMLKAKELKKQQEMEQEQLQEQMRQMAIQEKSCAIDLMKAVQKPGQPEPQHMQAVLRPSSSFESLILEYKEFVSNSPNQASSSDWIPPPLPPEPEPQPRPQLEPLLPIKTDMSYMLKQKVKMGRCSGFGKVLSSRLKPVAAPYFREKAPKNIVRFDFSSKSPCDLIKEKLKRKPVHTSSNSYHDFF